jgi:hypothetical protein
MPKILFLIFEAPAPVLASPEMLAISISFSMSYLPRAPVAEVTASCALVLIFRTSFPSSTETVLVVVLPMSMPTIMKFRPFYFYNTA